MHRPHQTVRRWLLALVAAAVLPTLVAAAAALVYAYKEEQATFESALGDSTRALALLVDREIARREAIALTLAGSPMLTRGELQAFHEYAVQVAGTREKVVVLHALDGRQLVNSRLAFGAPLPPSSLDSQRQAAGPNATVVSNVYFAPVGRQYSFAVQVPVMREGRPIYYLSVAGYASALQPMLMEQRLPAGSIISVLDAKGTIVARSVSPERYVGQPASERLAGQLAQRQEGAFESVSVDGRPILASFSKSPVYGWAVVVGVPLSAVSAPPGIVLGFGALAIVLLGASVLAAVVVGRRLLVPVQRLEGASHRLGSGQPLSVGTTGLRETDQVLAALVRADHRILETNLALEVRRKEAEAAAHALRMSNERVQLATENSGLGLFTWDSGTDRITWQNDRPYEILGLSQAEPAVAASRFVSGFLHPDDRDQFTSALRRTLEDGTTLRFQGRIRRTEGELRWVEFTARRQEAAPGESPVVVGTASDITERRRAQEALREEEERLRQLANTMPTLAWMADANGWATWYNDRWFEYTGTTLEEMQGSGWEGVLDPAAMEEVARRWTESVATGEPLEMTFPLRGKDGVHRPFFTRAAPLRDASGAIVRWFGTNMDVSPLKKAEDELREADRRKDEFIAMLAHELRNPLAPIRNAAEILKRVRTQEPQVGRASEIIARQVSHMAGLLNDLLDVSRIARGLISIESERVSVAAFVSAAVEQVRSALEAKQHELVVDGEGGSAQVIGSPLRLTQVMANLLDNAAKYSPPGSLIQVQVRTNSDRVRIAVVDRGQGISPELLPRIFEPFTQHAKGAARSEGGLGLGLAVVRGLVELHGGSVQAYSEGPGRGSRFEVDLPQAPGEVLQNATQAGEATDVSSPTSLDILVVDDNADAADTLMSLLQSLGHRGRCAYTATQGLAAMEAGSWDAAILDIGLPEMTGYELATRCRQAGFRVGKLIALTGYGQAADRVASAAAGFAHHFVKPVELQLLLDALPSPGQMAEGDQRSAPAMPPTA